MLGMTLAWRLAQAGREVTIVEAAPDLGGLAGAWRIGDIVWDRHYHVTLLSDSHLRGLLAELGLEADLRWRRTLTGFFSDGGHHSMSNLVEFLRFPPIGLVDKLRLGYTIFHASRVADWRPLEDIPVERWLTRLSGRRVFERIWRPLLRSKLGDSYQRTSAAFIWATIARLYAARRSGLKEEMFGYLPGGYARLLSTFASRLAERGVRIRAGRPVQAIERTGGGLRVSFGGGQFERFDSVASTIPGLGAPCAAEYQGIVCASLLLRRPLTRYYVTNITEPWVPFTGVIDMSALVDRSEFGGNALVYLPKYVAPDDPMFEESDAAIRGRFLRALGTMYPAFDEADVLAFQVSRVRRVFPIPTLGYSSRVAPVRTDTPGLWAVNSSHIVNGTLNVNQTVELADRVAREMVASGAPARSRVEVA
jgi:protoporphyrinogen oxidase